MALSPTFADFSNEEVAVEIATDLPSRYESTLRFYEGRAHRSFVTYTVLKMAEIAMAAAIPVVALAGKSRIPAALLGALIASVEGFLALQKIHERWIAYRKAAESLRVEALMWETASGRYRDIDERDELFAEQLVAIVQQERSDWLAAFDKLSTSKEAE
jgi:Protein of unknown function (DUF4231)